MAPVAEVVGLADELSREAPSLDAGREAPVPIEELERREEELTVRGAEAERPMMGGGVAEGEGALEDGFDAGLSHEEKKSSSAPFAGEVAGVSETPSTAILAGNLAARV